MISKRLPDAMLEKPYGYNSRIGGMLAAAVLAALTAFANSAAGQMAVLIASETPKGAATSAPRDVHYGFLHGTVYDPNRAVIAAAEITARNEKTGQEFSTTTLSDGTYDLELARGDYTVRAASSGFKPSVVRAVRIRKGERLSLSFTLSVGPSDGTVNHAHRFRVTPSGVKGVELTIIHA